MSSGDSKNSAQNEKQYYRPSVTYQLRKRGLDLVQCNGDVYEAINKVTGGPFLEAIAPKSDGGNLKDCGGLLIQWCHLHERNVRIYVLDNKTRQIRNPIIFPDYYEKTVGISDKRGLFLHANHFEAVMPQSCISQVDSDYMKDLSVEHFISLCKRAWEDHGNEQQECGICFRKVKLSASHIIPHSILCMATKEYFQINRGILNPKSMAQKLLCFKSSQIVQSCEHMLANMESELHEFLAGPTWNKNMSPREVDGGLIYNFQEAVKRKTSVQFTVTMNHWHALISIAYRVLITWLGQLPDEQALGRLAKKLHHLTIFPYDDQKVCVWLLLSADGTKAIEKDGIDAKETILWQVAFVSHDGKGSIVVHFGIRGLHFIITDSDDTSRKLLTGDWQKLKCTIPIIVDRCFDVPYSHFKQNHELLPKLLLCYEHIIKPIGLYSSKKIKRDNTKEYPQFHGSFVRLPDNFIYNKDTGDLKLADKWTMCHKLKDILESFVLTGDDSSGKLFVCETMWILKNPKKNLNVVLRFIEHSPEDCAEPEYMVFGYSVTREGNIKGPMLHTNHTGIHVPLMVEGKEDIQSAIHYVFLTYKIN